MNKLLRANFTRMKKSRVFWLGMAAMMVFGVVVCLSQYNNKMNGALVTFDSVFSLAYIMSGILLAVFCSLFIGTEYSDGAMRNKLVVGRSRSSIYLANFVVSAVAGLLMNLIYLAVTCSLGIPMFGFFTADLPKVLILLLAGMLLTVAFAAIFSMLVMLNQSKALSAIVCSIGILAAIFLASFLYSALNEPEFINVYYAESGFSYVITVDGVNLKTETAPNPRYLTGFHREAFQFLMDFLPSGQMVQMVDMNIPNINLLPIYSMIIIVAANAGGALFFRRKDLK